MASGAKASAPRPQLWRNTPGPSTEILTPELGVGLPWWSLCLGDGGGDCDLTNEVHASDATLPSECVIIQSDE